MLVLLMVVRAIRWQAASVTVMFVLLLGLPALGFAVYAVQPGPPPNIQVALALAIVLYAVGVVVVISTVVRTARRRRPAVWDMATDARRFTIGLIARWFMVLWISSLLLLFEPGFAFAYLALNVVWMLVWLPRRLRTWTRRIETEIAAPPERVFEFVRDLRNWRLYRDDVELVSVTPDGPLQTGSEYVARVAIPESVRRTSYRQFESRYRITAMTPGEWFDTVLLSQATVVRTKVEPTPTGARLSNVTQTTMGLLRAWSADMLNNRRTYAALGPLEQRNRQRLKEMLEAPPAQ